MKPVPMTAAPMSCDAPCRGERSSDGVSTSRPGGCRRRSEQPSRQLDRSRHATAARGLRHHRTSACQVQKSDGGEDTSVAATRSRGAITAPTATPGPRSCARARPLPDEALDALVAVLDEIRLGRSRSRSDGRAPDRPGAGDRRRAFGELLDRGLVVEGEPGPSTGGRPPRQLAFRADAGHVLVADLGATSIDVAVTTLDGRILGHHDEPAESRRVRRSGWTGSRSCSASCRRPDAARAPLGHRHRRARPGGVRDRPADLAADHARLGRLPGPRAVRRALRRPGLGRQRRQRAGPRRVADRRRRRATTTSSSSRSGRASGPGSSPTAGSTGARRGLPATSATSRSPTTATSCAGAATSAASRRWPAARRSAATGRRPRSRAGRRLADGLEHGAR